MEIKMTDFLQDQKVGETGMNVHIGRVGGFCASCGVFFFFCF